MNHIQDNQAVDLLVTFLEAGPRAKPKVVIGLFGTALARVQHGRYARNIDLARDMGRIMPLLVTRLDRWLALSTCLSYHELAQHARRQGFTLIDPPASKADFIRAGLDNLETETKGLATMRR